MSHTTVYKEKFGVSGDSSVYIRESNGDGTLVQLSNGLASLPQRSFLSTFTNFFSEVFLPQGYPESVRDDYCRYQIWDTLQAFSSTISAILSTHAIMKSVGVGDASATALSATLTWVLKDGIGMIGRIIFAWWRGHALDTDAKKWRLFADFLNDAAFFLELLLLPICPEYPTHILCLTTSMKGIVGVAAGASRASITQHHAIRGNNGDVSAKDGSQETCVNLVASTVGMALLSFTENKRMIWMLFSTVTLIHLFANYKAVKSLALITFNGERLCRYLRQHLVSGESFSPQQVNQWESVIVGVSYRDLDLCGFRVVMGSSVEQLVTRGKVRSEQLMVLSDQFRARPYLLVADERTRSIHVLLQVQASIQDMLKAYLHSVMLAIVICRLSDIKLDIFKDLARTSLLTRIDQGLKRFSKSSAHLIDFKDQYPFEAISISDDIIDSVFITFIAGVKAQGWSLDGHSLDIDEWRGEWRIDNLNETRKEK